MKRFLAIGLTLLFITGCSQELEEAKDTAKEVENKVEEVKEEVKEQVKTFTPTEDEIKYMQSTGDSMSMYGEDIGVIQTLLADAQADPSIAKTEEWKKDITGRFFRIAMLNEVYLGMTKDGVVPERFEPLHAMLQDCFDLANKANRKIFDGIEQSDKATFEEGINLLTDSNTKLNEALAEIDEIVVQVSK